MQKITPAAPGTLIQAGTHRINLEASGYQPADITPFGIITTDGFMRDSQNQWICHQQLISAEVYNGQALIWMQSPSQEGRYYHADGTASDFISDNTIGTIVQRHETRCELLLNVMPEVEIVAKA